MKGVLVGIIGTLVVVGIFAAGIFAEKYFFPTTINTTTNTTNTTTNLPTEQRPVVTAPQPASPSSDVGLGNNLRKFTSPGLGISFTYLENQNGVTIATKEVNNEVYVYMTKTDPTTGQFVEVFSKDKNTSLVDAIKAKFLAGFSLTDCLVKPATKNTNYPASFEIENITVPMTPDDDLPSLSVKWDKCPKNYTSTNGISYFLTDQNHPDKFVYLSIGQYGINSSSNKMWQETLTFLD